MRLKEVVVQGKFCGMKTVEECILNFELHTMQMIPRNALEFECKELIRDIQAYEAGELILPWDEINDRVEQAYKEYEEWWDSRIGDEEDLDFRLNVV